jgi:ABC-2 type transport system ATP-binding protein
VLIARVNPRRHRPYSAAGRNADSDLRGKTGEGPAREPGGAARRASHEREEDRMTVIRIDGLYKSYGGFDAVRGVGFEAPSGRVVGLLGPNGAGKSTTLHVLLGLAAADAGTATIRGRRYAALERPAYVVGALLDAGGLHPGRSGRDHLRVLATAARVPAARVDEVLDLVGLTPAAHRRVRTYSLGMKQRLGIAAALMGRPEVLVLDEPANGLDPAGMRWLRELLRAFADDGGTVLLASHVLAEVTQVADDLVVVGQGRVVAAGPMDDLVTDRSLEDVYLDLTATTEGVR